MTFQKEVKKGAEKKSEELMAKILPLYLVKDLNTQIQQLVSEAWGGHRGNNNQKKPEAHLNQTAENKKQTNKKNLKRI